MKDISKLKTEVVSRLLDNARAVVDGYREKWDADLAELFTVNNDLDALEAHKAELEAEQRKLRPLVHKELERRNAIDRQFSRLNKTMAAARKKISELTARLTSVEQFNYPSAMLNFLSGADFKPDYAELVAKKEGLVAERKKLKKGK